MRLSVFYAPTLKEDPAEAEVASHRLLVRAGMVRKLTSGIYSYLPAGVRSLEKISRIVRDEMERAGSMEVLLPFVQPAELWQETGRWDRYGRELLRLKDRHQRDYCIGPTHEEVITDLVRREVRSYRQLPLNLYQIQTKFRDEIRPRFGIMRCREFIMKDAYSFDRDDASSEASYATMFQAYDRIFRRLGLSFRAVEADTGPIGGSYSHEFMVLAETGEDVVVTCAECEYAANLEKAEVPPPESAGAVAACPERSVVETPDMHTVRKVADFLGVEPRKVVKTLIYEADGGPVAALVPGDRELNEVKLANLLGASGVQLATAERIRELTGAPVGFSGPVGLGVDTVVADHALLADTDWVTGANAAEAHLVHVDLDRDARIARFADLAEVKETDPCPRCRGRLRFTRGIEVGHVFKLGTKYSRAMGASFLDAEGVSRDMIMGCYGIGVSRILAAAIEQNHDEAGIAFPPSIAPFEAAVLAINARDDKVSGQAETLYDILKNAGVDALLDDRDERPGYKFKDADLMGSSMQIIVGSQGLARGEVEVKDRRTGRRESLSLDNFASEFRTWRAQVWQGWGLSGEPAG
jgi:prolyl-tRNA synthetase